MERRKRIKALLYIYKQLSFLFAVTGTFQRSAGQAKKRKERQWQEEGGEEGEGGEGEEGEGGIPGPKDHRL